MDRKHDAEICFQGIFSLQSHLINLHNILQTTMRNNIKYLIIGLLIGFTTAAFFLGGLFVSSFNFFSDSFHSPTPVFNTTEPNNLYVQTTPTFTPTPTLIIPLTATPLPTLNFTATSTPESIVANILNSGYIFLTGSLTTDQQLQLYASSLKFRRSTTNEARILGETFNGHGYGSPSDICGPLSIAILQDAGIVDINLNPHDFWLLNPDVPENRKLLSQVFPPENYINQRIKVKLNRYDWNTYPLKPGDFIYIYAGTGGNFEHMLVVNRVDSQLRTYAVTNFNTSEGFIIDEVLLYDPADRHVGIFAQWTSKQFDILGSTGFDGFELWRPNKP